MTVLLGFRCFLPNRQKKEEDDLLMIQRRLLFVKFYLNRQHGHCIVGQLRSESVVVELRVVVGLATRKLMQSHIGVTADCVFRKARLSALKLWIWI